MNLVNLYSEVVCYPLDLHSQYPVSAMIRLCTASKREAAYDQILSHTLELIANVIVVRFLLPFPLEQIESLL